MAIFERKDKLSPEQKIKLELRTEIESLSSSLLEKLNYKLEQKHLDSALVDYVRLEAVDKLVQDIKREYNTTIINQADDSNIEPLKAAIEQIQREIKQAKTETKIIEKELDLTVLEDFKKDIEAEILKIKTTRTGGSGYSQILDNGVKVARKNTINFHGNGVTVSNEGNYTDIEILGGSGDRYKTTSTTTNTIVSTGSLTFTVDAGLSYTILQEVVIIYDGSNYMHGTITSYSGTTLIVDIRHKTGSGTYSSWTINLDGTPVDAVTGSGTAGQMTKWSASGVITNAVANVDYATAISSSTGNIDVSGSDINVNTGYSFVWGATHTWGAGAQIIKEGGDIDLNEGIRLRNRETNRPILIFENPDGSRYAGFAAPDFDTYAPNVLWKVPTEDAAGVFKSDGSTNMSIGLVDLATETAGQIDLATQVTGTIQPANINYGIHLALHYQWGIIY